MPAWIYISDEKAESQPTLPGITSESGFGFTGAAMMMLFYFEGWSEDVVVDVCLFGLVLYSYVPAWYEYPQGVKSKLSMQLRRGYLQTSKGLVPLCRLAIISKKCKF